MEVGVHGLHFSDGKAGVCVGEEILFSLVDINLHSIINSQELWSLSQYIEC